MMQLWKRRVALALATVSLFPGCFRYVPVRTDPATGARIALEVNDEGRVALAAALGPGVIRIEGNLIAMEGSEYILDAMMVEQLRLRPMSLDAVRVRVQKAHVVITEERKLSRARTLAFAGGAAVAVVTFFISKGWFGRSTPPDDTGGPGGPDQSRGISVLPAQRGPALAMWAQVVDDS